MNVLQSITGLDSAFHFYLLACSNCEQVKMMHPYLKVEIDYLALSSEFKDYLNHPANSNIKEELRISLNLLEVEGCFYLGCLAGATPVLFSNLKMPTRLLNRFWYQCTLFKEYITHLNTKKPVIENLISQFLTDAYCFFNCKISETIIKLPAKSLLNYFERYVNALEEISQIKPFNRQRTGRERGQMENLLKASNNIFWDAYALFEFFLNRHNPKNVPNWQFYYINRDTFFRAPENATNAINAANSYLLKGSYSDNPF